MLTPVRSLRAASPPFAESLRPHAGGHKVAVAHPPGTTQKVSQAVGDAGGGVASPLLCCRVAWKTFHNIQD